jgi:two-component system, OmpR family, phosphate regulon sensor histidine kinase PhoR
MQIGFRGRIFLAIFGVAGASLLLVATMVSLSLPGQTVGRIEQTLRNEGRLVADVLGERGVLDERPILEQEAQSLGRTLGARVTFIAADGVVVADSMVSGAALAELDNHGSRPEVQQARREGTGAARRFSDTLRTDMLYVAVRTPHPTVETVRLALPLTEVQAQIAEVRRLTLIALAVALFGAIALAGISSALLAGRLNAIAVAARRFASGDLSRPVRDYEKDEIGTVARVLDDTVRELAVRLSELAQDRARTDAILSGMVEGVMVVDEAGRVQLVNPAARSILGLTQDAATRHYLEFVRHPDVAALLTAALDGREPTTIEFSPPRASERRIVGRSAAVSAPDSGGAVLVLHDITDLRRADQMRRDFVANVSHELRTPLTAIRGYVEALGDEPVTPEDRSRFLEVIGRHVQRMERLVKDLLRLAGLDARQETLDLTDSPAQALLAGAVADLAPVIEARTQRVDVTVDPAAAMLRTDAPKLQDVLRNLLENAANYSPEGRRIELALRTDADRCLITVSDEGPGIPEDDLERIFERFYRVDKARSRESGGTGLGLSIVKHLVDLLGGRVWAANRRGGGAVFTISLPGEVVVRQAP